MSPTIPYRPLAIIQNMLARLGQNVSYAYDDLIFLEHNAYLLQMTPQGERLLVHFNQSCDPQQRPGLLQSLKQAAAEEGLRLRWRGFYRLEEQNDKQVAIHFQKWDDFCE